MAKGQHQLIKYQLQVRPELVYLKCVDKGKGVSAIDYLGIQELKMIEYHQSLNS
jgi:hypothetical protein